MFYQYVFRYFRLTSLIEDPEISDIHCIAYNKIRIKKKGKRQEADVRFASNQEYREFIDRVATQMVLISQILMLFRGLPTMKRMITIYCDLR